jgi:hypothetical protein
MVSNETVQEPLEVMTVGDRLCVRVPWERADHWQARLADQGIVSTLHLDPAVRESHLELWSVADLRRVQAVLQQLGA